MLLLQHDELGAYAVRVDRKQQRLWILFAPGGGGGAPGGVVAVLHDLGFAVDSQSASSRVPDMAAPSLRGPRRPSEGGADEQGACQGHTHGGPTSQSVSSSSVQWDSRRVLVSVSGMTCGVCVAAVEAVLKREPGVISASVNLVTGEAAVQYDPLLAGPHAIMQQVREAGYGADIVCSDEGEGAPTMSGSAAQRDAVAWRRRTLVSAALTLPVFIIAMLAMLPATHERIEGHSSYVVRALPWAWLVESALATGVQFWVGSVFYRAAYYGIRTRHLNMSLLVALGTSAAYVYSVIAIGLAAAAMPGASPQHVYFETSSLIITFVCLGKWIETHAKVSWGWLTLTHVLFASVLMANDKLQPLMAVSSLPSRSPVMCPCASVLAVKDRRRGGIAHGPASQDRHAHHR